MGPKQNQGHIIHETLDEESKKLLLFYTPMELYMYNTLVMGTAPASSEYQENIRLILEGLDGVQQIKDDLVVHIIGQEHDVRLSAVLQRLQEFGLTLRLEKC